ncbi:MAG: VWA domain-containing protein [Alphaproteobacteria bacterium]|nr:VWA domain-containing protein [Alphaproteobacteria bacterium]
MRIKIAVFTSVLVCGFAVSASGAVDERSETSSMSQDGLQIEIQSPSDQFVAANGERTIEVEGVASRIGGVRYLDMIFVMDTSGSLRKTDPKDFRSLGAIGLVESLSPRSDIKIGVVSFDGNGTLAQPMTSDRGQVAQALRTLRRSGSTNLGAGILTALQELEEHGRPGSSRVIMLFTDGQSNRKKAHLAAVKAQSQGVTVQTLLLGKNRTGSEILGEIAWATGGTLVRVEDPAMLPEAFLNLKTTGVESVTLSANGSAPVPARLAGGTFIGTLPLQEGENRIVAFATSIDGQTRESVVTVTVRDASCAALEVAAMKAGRPVLSLNTKAVEIVVDASRSMWGRIDGQPKMVVAKNILEDVSYWFPEDLDLALRAYGSTSPSDINDCADSTLLVPFGDDNRESIRRAIAGLRPTGQTPIAYALNQASRDFSSLWDDRALVLVTDGIESCGGDPVRAARELREQGITVHLIGFGLGDAADEDTASLQAVANASGGRYVTAGSAAELQEALVQTVATSYSVYKGSIKVASSSLASNKPLYLPEGDYRVELHGSSPQSVRVSLAPRDRVTLTLQKERDFVSHFERRDRIEYRSCEDVAAYIERLEARQGTLEPYQTATN